MDAGTARRFEEYVAKLAREHRASQYALDTQHFIKGTIDEMALYFYRESDLKQFVEWCVAQGYDNFNSEQCAMHQTYGASEHGVPNYSQPFHVRFEFIQIPGAPYRIEAMTILSGSSAVHDLLGTGDVVHASWKYEDEQAYEKGIKTMATEVEPFKAIPFLAEYCNPYGRFAYFGVSGANGPYFKPRVNLRDIVEVGGEPCGSDA